VGRGFSRDIKLGEAKGALAPEVAQHGFFRNLFNPRRALFCRLLRVRVPDGLGLEQGLSMHASPAPSSICWNCGAPAAGAHFCPSCGKIQPLAAADDYFAFFALPEKLTIDADDLERRYLSLSWKLHPDNFVRAEEFERNLSLERGSQLNDAFRTLRDPVARVEYLLARKGVRKEGQTRQQAPPELLEEVFELNESLEELQMARESGGDGNEMKALRDRLHAAGQNFEEKLAEVDAELASACKEWDAAIDANADEKARSAIMARMNEILNRRSYIRNLVANVVRELDESAESK
jgi:molecular chaperone HscB